VQVTVLLPFLQRPVVILDKKLCLRSFGALAQYRRSDIESHGVSYGSLSTPKMKFLDAGAQKKE